jgi:hypothetical protein
MLPYPVEDLRAERGLPFPTKRGGEIWARDSRLPMGDGGLAVHVLGDPGGSTQNSYVEETEILAFGCFCNGPPYHHGPRNKNRSITRLGLYPARQQKLGPMIERTGYPGVAADLDLEKITSVLPMVKKAREMQRKAKALTDHRGFSLSESCR